MSEKETTQLFSRVPQRAWNFVVNPLVDGTDTTIYQKDKQKKKRWFSSKARKLPFSALVALLLLGFGAILLSLGIGLRYGYSAGVIVFGLISLALGVLIGWNS